MDPGIHQVNPGFFFRRAWATSPVENHIQKNPFKRIPINEQPLAGQSVNGKKQLFGETQLLYTLIDNMPDFIYIKDTDSRFIVGNKKIMDVRGLKSRDQLIGKSDHDFYRKELADKFRRNEQHIFSTGKPLINQEEKGLDADGNEIFLSTTKIPLYDEDGKIIGIAGIGRDITEQSRRGKAGGSCRPASADQCHPGGKTGGNSATG